MFVTVVLAVFVIGLLFVSGYLLKADHELDEMLILFLFGLVSVMMLVFSPIWNPSGKPVVGNIGPGTYKVAFVYVAGENVNVAVEWKADETSNENIYHYQLKKNAFEGTLNPNAKKLVVVQTGNFKKLHLE